MSFTLELFELPEIFQVLGEIRRVLKIDGKLGVVSLSKEEEGSLLRLYEWAHQKWPRYIDCRPIYTKELLVDAGFDIKSWQKMHMLGLPLDIVIAVNGKPDLHQ